MQEEIPQEAKVLSYINPNLTSNKRRQLSKIEEQLVRKNYSEQYVTIKYVNGKSMQEIERSK